MKYGMKKTKAKKPAMKKKKPKARKYSY